MSAGGESGNADERGVEAVLVSLGTDEAHCGLDVVDLRRELGVHAGAVVGAYEGVAGVEEGLAYAVEIGHSLGTVGEPGAAVDVDYDGIGVALLRRKVDVQFVIHLAIARIIHVKELLAATDLGHAEVETCQLGRRHAARRLRPKPGKDAEPQDCRKDEPFHY